MIIVREARPADAPAIARVHVDSWRSAYAGMLPDNVLIGMSLQTHTQRWARIIGSRRKGETVLVSEVPNAGVVGFGSCGRAGVRQLPLSGEIYTLYVHPEWQDRGLGRRLLRRLFDSLVVRGMNSAVVWVLAENPSRFFYETMGGRRVAERSTTHWNTLLRETAYGWNDVTRVRSRSDAGRAP
jgi:ribosomal protein S18 acetylase RimI-like enzyme